MRDLFFFLLTICLFFAGCVNQPPQVDFGKSQIELIRIAYQNGQYTQVDQKFSPAFSLDYKQHDVEEVRDRLTKEFSWQLADVTSASLAEVSSGDTAEVAQVDSSVKLGQVFQAYADSAGVELRWHWSVVERYGDRVVDLRQRQLESALCKGSFETVKKLLPRRFAVMVWSARNLLVVYDRGCEAYLAREIGYYEFTYKFDIRPVPGLAGDVFYPDDNGGVLSPSSHYLFKFKCGNDFLPDSDIVPSNSLWPESQLSRHGHLVDFQYQPMMQDDAGMFSGTVGIFSNGNIVMIKLRRDVAENYLGPINQPVEVMFALDRDQNNEWRVRPMNLVVAKPLN